MAQASVFEAEAALDLLGETAVSVKSDQESFHLGMLMLVTSLRCQLPSVAASAII